MKCLQAMALGWAMGVEERPRLGPVRVEDGSDYQALVAQMERERVGASELEDEVSRLHAEMDALGEKLIAVQAENERLRVQLDRTEAHAGRWYDDWKALYNDTHPDEETYVSRLPEGYLDGKASLQREAEIAAEIESPAFQRELEEMAASEHLEVEVLDEANATIRPKVDETPPPPESVPLPPEAAPAAQAPEPEAPKPARVYKGLGDPEWVHPDAPAFIADNIEPSDNPADYVTTARISSTLAAWNTETGKNLGSTPAYREIARRFMRGKPIHDGKQVDGYYGMKLSGEADGTMPFVPDARYDTAYRGADDERLGIKGAWKSPESRYIDACVTAFLDRNLVVTQDLNDWLAGPDLRAAYDEWAHANGKPDSNAYPGVERVIGSLAAKRAVAKRQRSYSAERPDYKPLHLRGVRLGTVPVEKKEAEPEPRTEAQKDWDAIRPEETRVEDPTPSVGDVGAGSPETTATTTAKPKITPADLDPRVKNKRDVEELRSLMKASTSRIEETPTASEPIPPGPDELAVKLAQLKHFGIGGEHGVSRAAATAAVADLHPTGNEVWTWSPPANDKPVDDADLQAAATQLLVKCMNGLPDEYGYDYKDDVLATAGFVAEDVEAALRKPHRVEIRPESWDKEKRYPVLGFTRGDVQVILGMRTPSKPRVIAAYWNPLLQADNYRVNRHGGGGSKKSTGLPTNPGTSMSRLKTMGCELEGDPLKDKAVKVVYKGQDLGKITCGSAVSKLTVQGDYQRTLRKMQAIDRREEAKAG